MKRRVDPRLQRVVCTAHDGPLLKPLDERMPFLVNISPEDPGPSGYLALWRVKRRALEFVRWEKPEAETGFQVIFAVIKWGQLFK